jgi:thymidylate synthase
MHITTRNVNTAFQELVTIFRDGYKFSGRYRDLGGKCTIVERPSRNGNVLMIDEPVTVTYTHPRERVLFNEARDVNPFFHMYEALWMLAGRNDVESVAYYASNMKNYSDNGKTLNGAYGYRWRHAWSQDDLSQHDQIQIIIDHLRADQNSRRAVLQMWNVEDDLLKIGGGCPTCNGQWTEEQAIKLDEKSPSQGGVCPNCSGTNKPFIDSKIFKDVCCNLSVMFSIREEGLTIERFLNSKHIKSDGNVATMRPPTPKSFLDMTVTNRSNDMIWGMLGANYVHFTILQEYIAGCLGVEVGLYHHFTNNLHVYENNWKPDEWLKEPQQFGFHSSNGDDWGGQYRDWKTIPLVKDQATFDREVELFVRQFDGSTEASVPGRNSANNYIEPFLRYVAQPMLMAFQAYKRRERDVEAMLVALEWCKEIQADDWRIAATNWINRRKEKKKNG